MSNDVIRKAMEARLDAWAKAQVPPIPVAFENSGYKPLAGQRYLRGTLIPAHPLNPSVGGNHKHRHGIYQVDVLVPAGTGATVSGPLTKAIEALFVAPTTMTRDGLKVNVLRTPAIGHGAPDDSGFWIVPVTIWYDADDFS